MGVVSVSPCPTATSGVMQLFQSQQQSPPLLRGVFPVTRGSGGAFSISTRNNDLLSQREGREICVRVSSSFHFKQGYCSCGELLVIPYEEVLKAEALFAQIVTRGFESYMSNLMAYFCLFQQIEHLCNEIDGYRGRTMSPLWSLVMKKILQIQSMKDQAPSEIIS